MADAGLILGCFDHFRVMREKEPVAFNERLGMWEIFRYEDVLRVMTDVGEFSSRVYDHPAFADDGPLAGTMVMSDPPRHRQLRGLASQAFTARRVATLEARIREITGGLLDAVQAAGAMEVVADLAQPMALITIAELLGIDPDHRALYRRWADAVMETLVVTPDAEQAQAIRDMRDYMTQVAHERRRDPRADFISALVHAEVDGLKLSDRELMNFCTLLLVAGNGTTKNLIGNVVICLDQHPEVFHRLRRDPALLPAVIEETLRYMSPVQRSFKLATTDVRLGDTVIPADEMVQPVIGSANRDPAQFPDPDRFDLSRDTSRHLAFYYGIHFCLGAALARLQTRIVLSAMLDRLPGQWRLPDTPLEPVPEFIHCAAASLPLTWDG